MGKGNIFELHRLNFKVLTLIQSSHKISHKITTFAHTIHLTHANLLPRLLSAIEVSNFSLNRDPKLRFEVR